MFGIKTSGAIVPTLTRRSLLYGLACACCGTSRSLATTLITGVLCATRTGSGLEVGTLLKTTGDPQLDKSLISEMTMQSKFYGYRPAFVLYSGGEKNAAAVNKTLADYPQTDGTILYNIDMLREQLSLSRWGGSILAGVIAHEFAHIYQYHNDYLRRLLGLDQTVKFVELHADFLSGFYMGGKSGSIEVKDYANAFFEIGDYEFNAPAHHGTPAERYLALKAGFNLRIRHKSASVRDAATEAVAFLKEYIH
jgi:hypothetical protein